MQDVTPFISVVIATYNRSAILPRCLDSLCNQTYPQERYEIVVINDGSGDNTEKILREYEKKAPCRFIWITQENHGRSFTRNVGIAKSNGEFVCFTDDDCIAEKNWIERLVRGFIDDSTGAVGGEVVSYQTATPVQQFIVDARILNQESFFKRNTLITGNAAYRKQVLNDIHGFDNFLIACEDLDISIRTQLSGFTLRYVPDAVVYHDHPATVKSLFFQQYRNGKGFVQLHRKYAKRYNLVLVTGVYGFQILVQFLRFPFALLSGLKSEKKKNVAFYPLFYALCESAMLSGIIRETVIGEKYNGEPIRSRVDFFTFMDRITIPLLWQRLKKRILKK
jgi:cellulose synthase/poly-beta-1,6-N-acetylglucosamine synthase-like glycosyltransferase